MCGWPIIGAATNAIMQQAFGEPVVYQPVEGGVPVGDPLTIVVVRDARVREESGAAANFEGIGVNPADLPVPPQRGDWVTAWGLQFVVAAVRQPDPYGMAQLSLTLRAGQAAN
jgi:hypothetical protein